jgi:hypothetical protein
VLVVSCALKTLGSSTVIKQKIIFTPNFPRIGFSYPCAEHLCACLLLAPGCGAEVRLAGARRTTL